MREMKDSGIEWVGKVPATWKVMPNKYIMTKKKVIKVVYDDENIISLSMNGVIVRDLEAGGKMPKTFDGYQIVYPGNLLMCLFDYDVTPRCIGLIKDYGVTSPAYSQFVMNNGNYSRYYYYYYLMVDHTKALLHLAKNLRHSFTEEQLGAILAPVPTIEEQHQIVHYLDTQCSEIDATAEDIQKEISLLEEYKKSVITEAVTKGLNPDAEMKNSGIEWIGEIPKHWKVIRFKYIAIVKSNLVAPIRYINYPQIAPDVIEKDTGKIISHRSVEEASVDSWNHLFYKGQILYSKIRPVLNKVIIAPYDGLCSADMYPISAKENVRFLQYIMLSAFFVKQVDLVTRDRIKMPKINQDELGNILLVWTSKEEQQQIADYLDTKCSEIDTLIADKKRQLDILAEYKKSLIYEYVTGKKEVPVNE